MTARVIDEELVVSVHPRLGQRIVYVLPVIPEDAPYVVREGIARRRVAATTGECPCGAVVDYGDRLPGQAGVAEVLHERSCPAATAKLIKACRRWIR